MSVDLETLRNAVAKHGRVVRVVVAEVAGSVPREPGAAMLVWAGGQSGTIGGGTLEFEAASRAQSQIADSIDRIPLGPALGQCCGGAVILVSEIYDAARIATLTEPYILRNLGSTTDIPLAIQRQLKEARNASQPTALTFADNWLLEAVAAPRTPLWIFGAGHVGRALIGVLAPLEQFDLTWIDTGPERYPDRVPAGVTQLIAANPADLVVYAPADAQHLILTYSHSLDLELCHRLLAHGFAAAGLIGSRTKWARFRKRLGDLGHSEAQIARIQCPIGRPDLGKHPQAIAIGVASELLSLRARSEAKKGQGKLNGKN